MRVAVFSSRGYERASLRAANEPLELALEFFDTALDRDTVALAAGCPAVCVFVNDRLDAAVLARLAAGGTRLVALRCAGFNNVDLRAAEAAGITVVRVPAYSPHAVAEFSVGLLLALNRRICRAWSRARENNFALEGLVGRDLHGKTVGVVGTGRIGALVARAYRLGFGCEVLACDVVADPDLERIGVRYCDLPELIGSCDVVTLHCPLTPQTHHLIDAASLARARPGLLLVNTARGALIDTRALIEALKAGRVGGVALDVYEQEENLFFADLSNEVNTDDVFQRLLTFPNVIVTGHLAFCTTEALAAIAETTLGSIADFETGRLDPARVVRADTHLAEG